MRSTGRSFVDRSLTAWTVPWTAAWHEGKLAVPRSTRQSCTDSMEALVSSLERIGINIDRKWLQIFLQDSVGTVEDVMRAFLATDLRHCGAGTLPTGLETSNFLGGIHVLQIDEAVDINLPAKDRFLGKRGNTNRCLKMALTDGKANVVAFERRAIDWKGSAEDLVGIKIAVKDLEVVRGMLVLDSERLVILGGSSALLREARDRAVARWNARRTRAEMIRGGSVQERIEEARIAAWSGFRTNENVENSTLDPEHAVAGCRETLALPLHGGGTVAQQSGPNDQMIPASTNLNACNVLEIRDEAKVHHHFVTGTNCQAKTNVQSNPGSKDFGACSGIQTRQCQLDLADPTEEELEAMREFHPHRIPIVVNSLTKHCSLPKHSSERGNNRDCETTRNTPAIPQLELEEIDQQSPGSSPSISLASPILSVDQCPAQHLLIAPTQEAQSNPSPVLETIAIVHLKDFLDGYQSKLSMGGKVEVFIKGIFTDLKLEIRRSEYAAVGVLDDGTSSMEVCIPHSILEEKLFGMTPAQFEMISNDEESKKKVADRLSVFSDFDGLVRVCFPCANSKAHIVALEELKKESCKKLAYDVLQGLGR